ncbi:MAG TPA: bifunctional diaminohydroxyphosphoribosylaminopyrimidine deaminase/5-amino-6-(5-phosphoribosylamino)uracil reductase RibD [Paracoccaceae bacterium]|nr:bifunctional diaminohydroxyphosphoribosylaminopyrimidine deaminase/5-amino-6-(5-phosphoribosylamino)uracil reductase RibD [Paracoccaceae bacterium]
MPSGDIGVDDARWLAAAASLASRGRPHSAPNPAVAAIVVKHGIVLGRGVTAPGGRPHAEALALEESGAAACGATLYVTLEPCAHPSARGPDCTGLVTQAGLARVVVGCADPDPRTNGAGIARLRTAGITVDLADDPACRASLAGFLTRQQLGRPHVTLKLAVSRDGFIAPLSGEPVTITGPIARAHVHRQRALAEAILVGGGTMRRDNPRLDVRLAGLEQRSPRRFVLTSGEAPGGWEKLARPENVASLLPLQYLYVEGGAATAAAFIGAGLVDLLQVYCAPHDLGAGIPAYGSLGPAPDGSAPAGFTCVDRRRIGGDMLLTYLPD